MTIYKVKRFSIISSIWDKFKSLGKGIKHLISNIFHPLSEKHVGKIHPCQKQFSDAINDDQYKETVSLLPPEYFKLLDLKWKSLMKYKSLFEMKNFCKYFPTLMGLVSTGLISKFRNDTKGKWSEIIYMYYDQDKDNSEELVVCYDFENKYWFFRDFTYNPFKEYKSSWGILETLSYLFDPENDPLLEKRVESITDESLKETVSDYLKWISNEFKKKI